MYVSLCDPARKVFSVSLAQLRCCVFVVSERVGGIGLAGGFCLGGDEVTSVPAICSWGPAGGAAMGSLRWWPPLISGQKSSALYLERLGLLVWPGPTVNFSLRIEPPVPRETSLHFPRAESRNVLWLCFLWVRVVAPLVSQCFLCFPVSVERMKTGCLGGNRGRGTFRGLMQSPQSVERSYRTELRAKHGRPTLQLALNAPITVLWRSRGGQNHQVWF